MNKLIKYFMLTVVSLTLVINLTACQSTPANSDNNKETRASSEATKNDSGTASGAVNEADLKEAPMLAEQVKAGKLPKLEDRLPVAQDVMIEPDIKELGKYGGSIITHVTDNGRWDFGPYLEQSMFRFKQDGSGTVEPNVCKNFYPNEDSTVWTIELREGMKWSDGHPFTADDVIFYYNHMSTPAMNPDRTPVPADDKENYYNAFTSKPYNCYQVEKDGKRYWAKFDKVSDYKFTVTFAASKPSFPVNVAIDNKWMFAPKHFFKDYVARKDGVADDPTFPLITEEQAIANANKMFEKTWESYTTMGKDIGYYNWDYYQIPQLRSFVATKNNWNKIGETYELVRNPYFFKTDSKGRQLPYLDSIKFFIINENDQINLKKAAGEFDLFTSGGPELSLIYGATQDTHDMVIGSTANWNSITLSLNQTVKDLDKRKLFQDIRFREALSISIDRKLISDTISDGRVKPAQLAPPKGLRGHDPEWSNKWTEFDVDKANKLLDEITEPWDKKEGTYRKLKGTNKELTLLLNMSPKNLGEKGDYITIFKTSWACVGIKFLEKVEGDVAKLILANDHEMTFDGLSGLSPALRPDTMIPMRNYMGWYGAYGKWYEDNKSEQNGGIAPTGDILELVNAYENIKNAVGPDRERIVNENIDRIYELHKKNVWVLGIAELEPVRYFINKKLRNFPEGLVIADEYRKENLARPEQFYLAAP